MKNLLKSPAVKNLSLKRREIDEPIEVAKIYRTDVYWEGKVAWSYCDWAKSKNGVLCMEFRRIHDDFDSKTILLVSTPN